MSHAFTPWWLSPILTAALAGLGALYMGKTQAANDMIQRISTLEAHQLDTTSRLDRIETKVDKIVDVLVAK